MTRRSAPEGAPAVAAAKRDHEHHNADSTKPRVIPEALDAFDDQAPAPVRLSRIHDFLVERVGRLEDGRPPITSAEVEPVARQVRDLAVELLRRGYGEDAADAAMAFAERLDETAEMAAFIERHGAAA